jgi:acid phosphatase
MKITTTTAIVGTLLASYAQAVPTVDETYPYTGPDVPVGDWADNTVAGNGKGFPRLVEPPAVKPASGHPSNNINVIALSYAGTGVNIHYQTPFGLGVAPSVEWGTRAASLSTTATGSTHSYVLSTRKCSPFIFCSNVRIQIRPHSTMLRDRRHPV